MEPLNTGQYISQTFWFPARVHKTRLRIAPHPRFDEVSARPRGFRQNTNRPFPQVVRDFGRIDAIESGLIKIPQLAVRDTSGNACPDISTSGVGYFHS